VESVTAAVNHASLSFYPPCGKQRLTPSPLARTDQGTLVQIVEVVPVTGADRSPVPAEVVKRRLIEQGFYPVAWGRGGLFERGQIESIFAPEMEVSVGEEAGELTDVSCRFTPPRRRLPPVADWVVFGLKRGPSPVRRG
jgi:hypothetical protein